MFSGKIKRDIELFKKLNYFSYLLKDSSKQPKKYLANELRESISQISQLLLESRGIGNGCKTKFQFLQHLLHHMALVFEHCEENLIQIPKVSLEVFGARMVKIITGKL